MGTTSTSDLEKATFSKLVMKYYLIAIILIIYFLNPLFIVFFLVILPFGPQVVETDTLADMETADIFRGYDS